ncbi:hypothetical protein TTHERM_000705203 (macronuclear) [Tetrahymena thermophila SB210]|uniref:Uncharacterized protein n=1 Tax=Tetrahymena thermophila (strain SB210) TaxID=312017 RepID=W7X8I0_TETTS|nr:hypothetical protein TTHERM_000705203 [Tetrahymena thermophila SB210]EWS75685.1 hypothetical protein TTHERM_000705203 [Tetrahymena thermophila SB210]|eukprot:XP_012651758.1 hypothetical protein TTHERM_000705203 [Tetrahymena thermophila SB210]
MSNHLLIRYLHFKRKQDTNKACVNIFSEQTKYLQFSTLFINTTPKYLVFLYAYQLIVYDTVLQKQLINKNIYLLIKIYTPQIIKSSHITHGQARNLKILIKNFITHVQLISEQQSIEIFCLTL